MLAIIIPFFKIAFFEDTLLSLENQTNKNFKVYIGDDASPEDCTQLLDSFKSKFDFLYYRFEENVGGGNLVEQWNRCIGLSEQEEWLMILGDDDVLGPNVVDDFYKNINDINQCNVNVVRFSTQCIDEKGRFVSRVFTNQKKSKSSRLFISKLNGKSRSSLSEHIFRRSVYTKIGFRNYKMAWHSDDMAWLEFSDFGDIFCIDSEKIFIRISNLSITGSDNKLDIKLDSSYFFYRELLHKHRKHFSKKDVDLILRIYETRLLNVQGKTLKGYFHLLSLYLGYRIYFSLIQFSGRFLFKK